MNAHKMLFHGDTPICQNCVCLSKSKDILLDSNSWWKYNFDIEVKGQDHSSWMFVTHCTMVIRSRTKQSIACQPKKGIWAGHESAQTNGQTEWPLYTPLNFVHGRYNERKCVQADILQAQAWLKSAVHNECQMPCISNGQLDRKSIQSNIGYTRIHIL